MLLPKVKKAETECLSGVLYLFFGAFEVVFQENHNFQLWQVGLSFSGLLVGMVRSLALSSGSLLAWTP